MQEKYFRYMVILFFAISFLMVLAGFFSTDDRYNVNVTQMVSADQGLDLKAVGEILKKSQNAEEFEKLLNDPATKVNNLDLDEDGRVDFINVTEFGDDKVKGFSLTTRMPNQEIQEIATIKIEQSDSQKANVEYRGNESIYGPGHYYHSTWQPGLGTGMILGYLFGGLHRPYYSPWSYGYYPSNYRSYPPVSHDTYRTRADSLSGHSNYKSSSTGTINSSTRSPYRGMNATSIKTPLKNPTQSQKMFQARNPSRQIKSQGFGRKVSPSARGFGHTSRRSSSYSARRGFSGGFRGK